MADNNSLLDSAAAAGKSFYSNFQYVATNGTELVQSAAGGNVVNSNFQISFQKFNGENSIKNRVYLTVPSYYWKYGTAGNSLSEYGGGYGGIYFPVTPSIKQDYKANWTPTNAPHTNFGVYSYSNSQAGPISVSGQFPVQNSEEAEYWTATVAVLRALVKMRTGKDSIPGAPPPVCRFNAYGTDIFDNVPVVLTDFSITLPDDVDYITGANQQGNSGLLGKILGQTIPSNKVPTLSTISMTLVPVYSRREMANFSVDSFVNGSLSGRGYL